MARLLIYSILHFVVSFAGGLVEYRAQVLRSSAEANRHVAKP